MHLLVLHKEPIAGSTPSWVPMGDESSKRFRALVDVGSSVRRLLREGDARAAARTALGAHGPELFGFLVGVLDDLDAARALYADVGQRVASEIEGFRWRCALRIWLYGLCRRELRDRRLRRVRAPASSEARDSDPAVAVSMRRVRAPRALTRLRRSLGEEEREVLILRVDRGLDWEELAQTSLGEHATGGRLTVESRRLEACFAVILGRIEAAALGQRLVRPRG